MSSLRTCLLVLFVLLFGKCVHAQPSSLLRNGGFENGSAWSLGPGLSYDSKQFHSGKHSLRAEATSDAISEQLVYGVQPGQTLTVSGWLRTKGVTPQGGGGYAFLAVYQYDSERKLLQSNDFCQLSGTHDWSSAHWTFRTDPRIEYLAIHAGIFHATGTAWFDDVNLVGGEQPRDWKEPANPFKAARYRAAILDEPGLPIVGHITPTAAFRRVLDAEGIPLTALTADQLADAGRFNADLYDLLIVPTGATFPLQARRTLQAFLMRGGDLLTTGGHAFDNLVVRRNGLWTEYPRFMKQEMDRARDPQTALIPNGGFEQGPKGWETGNPAQCRVVEDGAFSGKRCALVHSDTVTEDVRYAATLAVRPGDTYLIGAQARTEKILGTGFAFLAVYQYDAAGKLVAYQDFAQIHETRDWKRYEARITISPLAAKVSFYGGLYQASGTLRFDDVTCAPVPFEERINAHYGKPEDGLEVTPMQLTLFSPDQPVQGNSLASAGNGLLPAAWSSPGAIRGFEATAQLRANARWIPLVETRDQFGRPSGVAGALVEHVAGPFAGSTCAIFGVENRDIFAGASGEELLRGVVRLLTAGIRAERLVTDYAFYRPGETMTARLSLARTPHPGRLREPVSVRFELRSPDSAASDPPLFASSLEIPAEDDGLHGRTFAWRVPANAPDFAIARAVLSSVDGKETLDTIETGFCTQNASVMRGGPRITYHHNAFYIDSDRPGMPRNEAHLLFGSDTYGNMFLSPSENPLIWFRDLQMMRDYGLHMYENLGYAPPDFRFNEAQWRQLDALIQLSQRFGLPYMAGLLIGQDVVVDDATLARQAEMCRAFAARYHETPGLIYYLNGDFQLIPKDIPDIRRLWNDFLKQRYGTDSALRAAWGARAPSESIGQIPVREFAVEGWHDVRAQDRNEFKVVLLRRWIGALCKAIRSVDTVHPITSEYYQRPYDGIDLRLSVDLMDAANFGYFAPPAQDIGQMMATLKWNDMRYAGKTVNMGEFGVKTHDAWAVERGGTNYHIMRTEEQYRQLFWWVTHAALALNVTKIHNWDWSDDPDNIFPWGIAWNNPLRPKPVLKLYRNLSLFAERIPRDNRRAPIVMLLNERWRIGAQEGVGYGGLMNALECLLATNAAFDVANVADLPKLAVNPPRLLMVPLAYSLRDEDIGLLKRIADAGCAVYLSGDPSLDGSGKRIAGRLETLCGVRFDRQETHASGLPMPVVTAAGAVKEEAGTSLYRFGIGKGAVYFAPEPWETLPGTDLFAASPEAASDTAKNLYLRLLPAAGVAPSVQSTAASGAWRVQETPAGANHLLTLFPRSVTQPITPVAVQSGGKSYGFEVRAGWPVSALLAPDGSPVAATGGRALLVNGEEQARGDSAWMLGSLDGKPLKSSAALFAALTDGGSLEWRSSAQNLSAWLVERRNGKATVVQPARIRRMGTGWQVTVSPNELLLVAPQKDLQKQLRALDRK